MADTDGIYFLEKMGAWCSGEVACGWWGGVCARVCVCVAVTTEIYLTGRAAIELRSS